MPSNEFYCILFLGILFVFMSSFLRGDFSAAGEDEEPTLPIVQAARTPPKRRTQVFLQIEAFRLFQTDQLSIEALIFSTPGHLPLLPTTFR